MASMDLNAELFRQLSIIAEDEGLMKKAVNALKRITGNGKTKTAIASKEFAPYTISELQARIARSEADIAEGRIYTEDELDEIELKEMPWLTE